LFAVAPKIAAVCLILRTMMGPFGGLIADWQQVITLIAIASMVLGAIAAIQQTNLKRLMAYSSIGHMGFALVGVAAGNQAGAQAVLIYMAIYLFMNVGTFAVILSMRKEGRYVENIADLAGLNKSHPLMALAMLIFMFSMAGIPPLAGFFSKWYVFFAAIEAGLFGLAVIGVLASVVGAFYYIRIIKVMYFDEAEAPLDSKISREMRIIMGFTAVVSLLFFILPAPVVDQAAAAAQTLFTN
jgi:NADH-quinone oxidoreductase subunit N